MPRAYNALKTGDTAFGKGDAMSNACEITNHSINEEFETLRDEMQLDKYWIRFFVRPCCPAPSFEGACEMLDKLKGEVFAHEGFSDEQKETLGDIIEARKDWYGKSGLCRKQA